jgi:uncharacterized protein involved in type VI secretion and phage assembly
MGSDLGNVFTAQILQAGAEAGKVFDPVIGVVTDNHDPAKLGRVKVKLPVLSSEDSTFWAPIVMLGAGKNRGWFFIPEIDDEVLVMFEHGEINRPIVVSALHNGKDKPPDRNPGGNPRRMIKSRAGHKITFDDDAMQIVLEDGGGKGRIILDANSQKIVIEALEGDVCFQAPQGELKIVAGELELHANGNLELHAGAGVAWGTDDCAKISARSVTLVGAKANLGGGGASSPAAPTSDPQDIEDPYGS